MSYCGERTAVKSTPTTKTAATLMCRSWSCEICGPNRKRQLIAQAIGGAPSLFLTLTLRRSKAATPFEAAKMLARGWRLLRLRIMRQRKWKRLPFIAVFEPHASGWPHLHIMLRSAYIDVKWISDQMAALLDSPVVYIEYISQRSRVAGYCAKYCGKGAAKFGTAKRYWCSQDYEVNKRPEHKKQKSPPGTWTVMNRMLWLIIRDWTERGWSCEKLSEKKVILRKPHDTS